MYRRSGLGALTDDLAAAIARFEGFATPGSVAQRNNNPGNLRSGPGQIGTDAQGFAIFPDVATGWAALDHQVDLNIGRGLSLQTFFAGEPGVYAGYAPSGDSNNPSQYASTVAGWLGIDPTVPLASISGAGDVLGASTSDFPAGGNGSVPGISLDSGLSWWAWAGIIAGGLLLVWGLVRE